MAPVQSRLVLAVTIPAAALAIFLSIFWLRRASKDHPPSPPDKKSKVKEKAVDQGDSEKNCDKVEADSCKKTISSDYETVRSSLPAETSCDSTFKSSLSSSKSNFCETDIQLNFETKKEGAKIQSILQTTLFEELEFDSKLPEKETVSLEYVYASGDTLGINLSKSIQQETLIASDKIEKSSCLDSSGTKTVNDCEKESSPVTEKKPVVNLEEIQFESVQGKENHSISTMINEETASSVKMDYTKETDVEKSDLAEKLANLELGTMKLGDVDVKERDSANHSPSENMLASPSMSNFSDAHSEGSSDSGKGHSDGTTSPSRTPAGGSSVSGDPSPSVYEFVIPQVIVGRLIGRHGVFLHEIMSATHTNIFIKVHPETTKLKICAIEGSQQDIDKALEMIRKKFPIRRYPKLTLERVSLVQMQHPQQLRSEDFHLQLIEGVNNDVILSSLLSPGQFFVQQPCHPSYPCLTPLTQTLTQAYSTTDAPALVSPVSDAICVCPSLGGWYRAQIVSVDEDAMHCDIKFVDYGGYIRVEAALLKQIRGDFLMLPFQAVECSLANVQPIHEAGWSEEARLFIHSITFGRVLQAQVVTYSDSGIPLVHLYTSINSQVVMVNAELVSHGFATFITPEVEDSSEVITDQVAV